MQVEPQNKISHNVINLTTSNVPFKQFINHLKTTESSDQNDLCSLSVVAPGNVITLNLIK